jgi:Spy/CpxP family protein refolding chaperone
MRCGGESGHQWGRVGLVLVVIGLWATVGWAQPGRGQVPVLLKAAGVTDDQKAQIKAVVVAHRPTLRNLRGQLRAANQTLSDALLTTGDPTSTVQQISQVHGQLLAETVKMQQEMLGVLTPDQLTKVAQLQDQLRALRAERHNLLRGGPPARSRSRQVAVAHRSLQAV